MHPVEFIRARGGFAPRHELRFADSALVRCIENGTLTRPRRGWYSTVHPGDDRYRAVAIGGRLTGISALHHRRAWMLRPPSLLHVAVPRSASRLRDFDAENVVLHWGPAREATTSHAVVGVRDALLRVALDEALDVAVPCFDWALSTGRIDEFEFESILRALPRPARVLRHWVDRGSQSLLESAARVRVLRRGWSVESQVRVSDLQSIDLVIEGQVALELDGRSFHESRFEEDRLKDLAITLEGRHSLRVSSRMLYGGWDRVEAAIESALSARRIDPYANSGNVLPIPRGSKVARDGGGNFA